MIKAKKPYNDHAANELLRECLKINTTTLIFMTTYLLDIDNKTAFFNYLSGSAIGIVNIYFIAKMLIKYLKIEQYFKVKLIKYCRNHKILKTIIF